MGFRNFGLYLRIYITDPNFFLNIFQKYMQHLTFDWKFDIRKFVSDY